jgi:hypothetical protein
MSKSLTGETVLRLRDPGDLVEAVPYLLGFHPRESLVLIGLLDYSVVLTTRVDLAEIDSGTDCGDDGGTDGPGGADGAACVVPETLKVIAGSGANAVVAVVYDRTQPRGGALPRRGLWTLLRPSSAVAELSLLDTLYVHGERWWSYECHDERCCPPEGRVLNAKSSLAAATATYAGLVALDDRGDLEELLAPEPSVSSDDLYPYLAELEAEAVQATLQGVGERHQRSVKRALFAAARLSDGQLLTTSADAGRRRELCRLGIGLNEIAVRDSVWIAIDHARLDGRSLWREMARYLPPPYAAPALFLFGWAEWRDGNAVLARIAAERALRTDPGYTGAQLLLGAISHAMDPHRTPRLRLPTRPERR